MCLEAGDWLVLLEIPQHNVVVLGAGHQVPSLHDKVQLVDAGSVEAEGTQQTTLYCAPDEDVFEASSQQLHGVWSEDGLVDR